MTTIYYEVDGQPVPADQCMWVISAPCGCDCSFALAEYCATEDEAWQQYSHSKAVRKRHEQLGYKLRIARRKGLKIADDCPHTPKWGVEPRPTPKGHTWATKHESRAVHLVPVEIEKGSVGDFFEPGGSPVVAVCGRVDAYSWSTRWYAFDGMLDCAGCTRAARKLLAAVVTR